MNPLRTTRTVLSTDNDVDPHTTTHDGRPL